MENYETKINELKDALNWDMWEFQIKVIMNATEVFDVVIGKTKKPILAKLKRQQEKGKVLIILYGKEAIAKLKNSSSRQ